MAWGSNAHGVAEISYMIILAVSYNSTQQYWSVHSASRTARTTTNMLNINMNKNINMNT